MRNRIRYSIGAAFFAIVGLVLVICGGSPAGGIAAACLASAFIGAATIS